MKEIELKILEVDKKEIEKKLLDLGAKRKGEKSIEEKHFDYSDGRIKKNKDLFRLRKVGDKTEIVYKDGKVQKDFCENVELETRVDDFVTMSKIIEKLGFKCIAHRQKTRTSFVLDRIKIEIDEYSGIPAYIEIEAPNRNLISDLLEKLGYNMNETTSKYAGEILKDYGVDNEFY